MQQAHLGNAVKNNLWTTDEDEHPDPDILPELPGFHVLVRPLASLHVRIWGTPQSRLFFFDAKLQLRLLR